MEQTIVLPASLKQARQEHRRLGDGELSYYYPSRADGSNDMHVCLGFRAPSSVVTRERCAMAWATLRIRHPLLSSRIVDSGNYEDVRFVHTAAASPQDAILEAGESLSHTISSCGQNEFLEPYLNGSRTLSSSRLSFLALSRPESAVYASLDEILEFQFILFTAHLLGDGFSLHRLSHEFLSLLGSGKSDVELGNFLTLEFERCRDMKLPKSMEETLVESSRRLTDAAARLDFQKSQDKLIGGQVFPRQKSATRHSVILRHEWEAEDTARILKRCKANGSSISDALFAVCNVAWARMAQSAEWPTMFYAAMNLRPQQSIPKQISPSYFYLAVGYYNVVLPTLFTTDINPSAVFWNRARSARDQCAAVGKDRLLKSRTKQMNADRAQRAIQFAKEDDAAADPTRQVPLVSAPTASAPPPSAPSLPLMGISSLGNLDVVHKQEEHPFIEIYSLVQFVRQRKGGALIFAYTFNGRTGLNLGYDVQGFAGDCMERFWSGMLAAVDQFLVKPQSQFVKARL